MNFPEILSELATVRRRPVCLSDMADPKMLFNLSFMKAGAIRWDVSYERILVG